MRGFVFTLDVLIGVCLLLAALFMMPSLTFTLPTQRYEHLSTVAEDVLNVLSVLSAVESNLPTVQKLRGTLSDVELNKSMLDLIASLWYAGNQSLAQNLSKEALEPYPHCFNLTIDGELIYQSCPYAGQSIATASRLETGYEVGKPVFGYVARAWLLSIENKTTQRVIDFNPQGSSYQRGRAFEVTKYFELPQNISILNGTFYVSLHYGSSQAAAEFISLLVNRVQLKAKVNWLYLKQLPGLPIYGTAAFGVLDVTQYLRPGENEVEVVIGTPELYHSHLHPGMRIVTTYKTNQTEWQYNESFRQRLYFDDVIGIRGVWNVFPFFIPPGATNVSAVLHLKAEGIENRLPQYVEGEWHEDVEVYLNSDDPIFVDPTPLPNPEYTLNLTPYLQNGTNVLSVFMNCYGDVAWGSDRNRIYSNPFNEPELSSYVELSYQLKALPTLGYLQVDLTREVLYNSEPSNPKQASFNTSRPVIQSFNHLATGFSSMVELKARGEEWVEVYESANVREVPTTIYISPQVFTIGKNYVWVRDFQPTGSTSLYNEILPWSSIEYTILVPAAVGYGDVFANRTQAIEDAVQRLLTLLQSYGIEFDPGQVQIQDKTVGGIRWLWGPSLFKLSAWERQ